MRSDARKRYCLDRNPNSLTFLCHRPVDHLGDHEALPGNPAGLRWANDGSFRNDTA